MRDAVIVSTARTPIGRAYKGAFNTTTGATLGHYSAKAAVERAGIDPGMIDDVVWGSALQQGSQAGNLARLGYMDYTSVTETFAMRRPRWKAD